ncbi:MAG: NifB/NifX family molybdenum-iron cluster-binding protein [Spirochaetota bacterium]
MKSTIVALPVFQDRLSPLFDEARKFIVITLEGDSIVEQAIVDISENSAFIRIERLKEMGVTVILCGAISDTLARFIIEREFLLYSWLRGTVSEVLEQYLQGTLPQTCMRYVKRGIEKTCKRHRRGWKLHQRGDYNENSNTSTEEQLRK